MANSYVNYTGDAVTTNFAVTFSFISRTHVSVTVDGVSTPFTWINDGLIQISPAPGASTIIHIARSSSPTTRLVTYVAGYLSADDLNTAYLHTFYLAQEAVDNVADSMILDSTINWDAENHRIKNLATPTQNSDAVTKLYVDTASSVAGNVPTPGGGNVGYYLKALTSTTFGWFNLLGSANTWGDVQTVRRSGTNSVSLECTAAGAGQGPFLRLWRDITGAANNVLGTLVHEANNASGTKVTAGEFDSETVAATAGAESYQYRWRTRSAGSLATRWKMFLGLFSANAVGGDKGADTINANGYYVGGALLLPPGIDGFQMSNNGSDVSNDIDIGAGRATSDDGTSWIVLASSLTKRIDASWAVGTGNGGMDTGSVANSTWYHMWAIMRPDTGVVDVLFSTSATAPTMPANYTKKRLIGAVYRTGASIIRPFFQRGNEFLWKDGGPGALDFGGVNALGTTPANFVCSSPTGRRTKVKLRVGMTAAEAANVLMYSPDTTDPSAPSATAYPLSNTRGNASQFFVIDYEIWTDTSAQIRAVSSLANTDWAGYAYGWVDPRGQDGL